MNYINTEDKWVENGGGGGGSGRGSNEYTHTLLIKCIFKKDIRRYISLIRKLLYQITLKNDIFQRARKIHAY